MLIMNQHTTNHDRTDNVDLMWLHNYHKEGGAYGITIYWNFNEARNDTIETILTKSQD